MPSATILALRPGYSTKLGTSMANIGAKKANRLKICVASATAIAVIVLVFFFVWNSLYGKPQLLLQPTNADIVALGQEVYAVNCASCHGKSLEGEKNWRSPDDFGMLPAPPHNIDGHTWHHTDDVLFGITKFGLAKFGGLKNHQSNMPIFDGILTDDEIIAALSYIKSYWPIETQKRHDELNYQKEKTKNQ